MIIISTFYVKDILITDLPTYITYLSHTFEPPTTYTHGGGDTFAVRHHPIPVRSDPIYT